MSSMFQITGVASGIEWDSIIEKLMTNARKPAEAWESKIDTLEYKRTLYQEISSSLYKTRNTLTKLKLESTYKAKTAEYIVRSPAGADPAAILKATPTVDAAVSAWDIEVQQLATTQRYVSDQQTDPSKALEIEGSFRVFVGHQMAIIEVEKDDTLRTINQKLQKATDQNGDIMLLEAKLVDNRLVIESAQTGLDSTGAVATQSMYMSESVPIKETINGKEVTSYKTYLQRTDDGTYPPTLIRLVDDETGNYYKEGYDYEYDPTDGSIKWLAVSTADPNYSPQRPAVGTSITVMCQAGLELSRGTGATTTLPSLDTLGDYYSVDPQDYYEIQNAKGEKLTYGTHYTIDFTDPKNPVINWVNGVAPNEKFTISIGANVNFSTNRNVVYLEEDQPESDKSVLVALGFKEKDSNGDYVFKPDQFTKAQDAKLTLNGIPVTRSDNEIDDLIANVTLELTGEGSIRLDITQDATAAIEGVQAFIDAYNEFMDLINYRMTEKYDSNTQSDDSDYLQSILSASKGTTTFGVLHGDQLLWSIKNQFRSTISNPVASMSSSLRSRKFLHPASALETEGSFYVYVGGNATRINVTKDHSLVDIQNMLNEATASNSVMGDSNAKTGGSMNLEVSISDDGQLVITTPSTTGSSSADQTHTFTRNTAQNYEVLGFVPVTSSPINGALTVTFGNTTYEEGVDYELEMVENEKGVLESRLVWLEGGSSPTPGKNYGLSYTCDASAVSYEFIQDTGDLTKLDLHYDTSKTQLSSLGIATESVENGKSGLLEFDTDAFFEAIKEDPNSVANVMTTFFRQVDAYIGNLVDSSQVSIGGTTATKGRIAAALNSIDTEVASLQEQIDKLDKQLEQKQTSLYKQYSDMEVAIQKLNSQMSSLSQYLDASSS